jgi:dGTPase
MLTELMNMIVPAALIYDSGIRPGLMEEKYLSLIPGNYKQVFLRNTAGMTDEQKVYHRILLATDTISGMTDSHARDLYAELNGI